MIIYNRLTNVLLSNISPAPNIVKYWADLKEDPSGKTIKTYTGGKWVKINGLSSSNEIDTKELNNIIEHLNAENTQLRNTNKDLTNLVMEQSKQIEELNNEISTLRNRINVEEV